MTKEDLIREWMEYSRMDLESAKYLTRMKPDPFEIICYHCQQSVEKSLKAVLIMKEIRPPKIHDLNELVSLCDIEELNSLLKLILPLNDYAVIVRYPSATILGKEDAKQAIHVAETVTSTIEKILHP